MRQFPNQNSRGPMYSQPETDPIVKRAGHKLGIFSAIAVGAAAVGVGLGVAGSGQDNVPPTNTDGQVLAPVDTDNNPTATTIVEVEPGDSLWSLAEDELKASGVSTTDEDYYDELVKVYDDAVRNNGSAIREGDKVSLLDLPDSGITIVDQVPRHSDQVPPSTLSPPATLPEGSSPADGYTPSR